MKKDELRDAVKGIHLDEEVKRDMIKNIKRRNGEKAKPWKGC